MAIEQDFDPKTGDDPNDGLYPTGKDPNERSWPKRFFQFPAQSVPTSPTKREDGPPSPASPDNISR